MKVLFLQKDVFAKPAIMVLSAILQKEGHSCELIIEDLGKNIIHEITKINPDIIAFSITTSEYTWMRKTGSEIKRNMDKYILCGGPHPTFFPEVINDSYLDAICIGEGDRALPEFIRVYSKGGSIKKVKNFIVKDKGKVYKNPVRPLISDLDSIPFYNRKIYDKYKIYKGQDNDVLYYNIVTTSRGCPYRCAFCFNKSYNETYKNKGKIFRRRSVSNVIEEIKILKDSGKRPELISFEDDIFTMPPVKWLEDFLKAYEKEVQIPFKINTRANLLNEKIVKALKSAGCYAVKIGVEAGNEAIRNKLLCKKISNDEIIHAAALTKKYNIKLQTFNILGNPGETLDMALETYDLNRKINPDFSWCSLLNPYPGTDIYTYSMENNHLEKNFDFKNGGHSYFIDTPIKILNKREICNLQKIFYFGVSFGLSKSIIKFLIRLPLSGFYKLIFGIGLYKGIKKINNSSFFSSWKLAFSHLFKYNFFDSI